MIQRTNSGRVSPFSAFVLAAVVLCAAFGGVSDALAAPGSVAVSNENLELVFDTATGSVRHWRLRDIEDVAGASRDLARPAGRLLVLRGTLGGVSLEEWARRAGGWSVHDQNADSVTLRLEQPAQAFSLETTWRLNDAGWRAGLQVRANIPSSVVKPEDRLWLEVGPGIAEIPAQGMGVAQTLYSYTEVVYGAAGEVVRIRLDDEKPVSSPIAEEASPEWVGLQSRYFAFVLGPTDEGAKAIQWSASTPDMPAYLGHGSFDTLLRAEIPLGSAGGGGPTTFSWEVFGGGKAFGALGAAQPDISGLMFSGLWNWMRVLAIGIMHTLNGIYAVVGSWGLSIILLAFAVRLLMHPLAKNAIAAQKEFVAVQERIQPELQEIKKNYKGGEQSERILQLYESHQVSPLAGMKPLLIVMLQIPVFVALFHLLGQAFELRNESFFWIDTLAEPDQLLSFGIDVPFFGSYFNLLPVLMAVTTMVSIKLAPAPAVSEKSSFRQNAMLAVMAIIFFLLFYSFPSGMVLYWAVANILQVLHQRLM